MRTITAILLAVTLAGAGVGIETEAEKAYTDDDLYCLAHIINAEAGDNNCTHEHRVAVGSVVLNRVADDDFPDTIREVVFQTEPSLQYSPIVNGSFEKEPSQDSWDTAEFLLENGSQIPKDCIWQAEFKQGSGEWNHYETIYGITYICYK